MTLHLHHLTGCTPAPLAYYLKALGILRIVGEQKDEAARGWWQDEHFCLLTKLDQAELEAFFLKEYAPTPVFNPWGARSGYYPGSSEGTARRALEKIESSSLSRVANFQAAIRKVRSAVEQAGGEKPDTDEAKSSLITSLRREVRGAGEQWLSAVMALVGEDYRAPALIGTGGNEGSGSYTSAYLNAVVLCVIDRSVDHALGLFSSSSETQVDSIPDYSWSGSFGQFLPEGTASAWDFLFVLEGATLFRSSVAVRSHARQALGEARGALDHFAGQGAWAWAGAVREVFDGNLRALDALAQIQKQPERLKDGVPLLVWYLAAARRLFDAEKPSLAVLLTYAAVERYVDLCLWVDFGLDGEKPDYALVAEQLVRAKYDEAGRKLFGKDYKQRDLDGPLMFANGAQLLAALAPERLALDDLGPLKGLSSARNKCEYEHGFLPKTPSHDEVEKYLAKAAEIIARACDGNNVLEDMLPEYLFPRLQAPTETSS